ncbi:hypothetical protein ACWEAF_13870 [Streptomyces sp. NPDC005071]
MLGATSNGSLLILHLAKKVKALDLRAPWDQLEVMKMAIESERNYARRERGLSMGQAIIDGVAAIAGIVKFIEWVVGILQNWM